MNSGLIRDMLLQPGQIAHINNNNNNDNNNNNNNNINNKWRFEKRDGKSYSGSSESEYKNKSS